MRKILFIFVVTVFAACASTPPTPVEPAKKNKVTAEPSKNLRCKGTHHYNPVEIAAVVVDVVATGKMKIATMSAVVTDLDDRKLEESKGTSVTGTPFDEKNPARRDLNIFAFSSTTNRGSKVSLILSPELEGTGYYLREKTGDQLAVKLTCELLKDFPRP